MRIDNTQGSWTLTGILLTVLIMGWMAMGVLKNYYKTNQGDVQTQNALTDSGLRTSTYRSALDSAKDQIGAVTQQSKEEGKLIDQAGR